MQANKPVQLLRLLSEEELRRMSKFLRSPYFNYSQPVVALFEQLRKHHPDYSAKTLTPEKIWKKAFPEQVFDGQKYWKLLTKLRNLIERFLAIEEVDKNERNYKRNLISALGKRNAHHLFAKETQNLIQRISSQPFQDAQSYQDNFELKRDYFFHTLTDKYRQAEYEVADAMHDLDRFFVMSKLRLASEVKNRERMFSEKIELELMEECSDLANRYILENPVFFIYRKVIELYDDKKSEPAFLDIKELLFHHIERIGQKDQLSILLSLRNYAVSRINKGDSTYLKKLFELYKLGLENDLTLQNGKINEGAFLNIVHLGSLEKEYDWVAQFIEEYKAYLPEEIREDATSLAYARYFKFQNMYQSTIDVLLNHQFKNILYQTNARGLLIQSWFEEFLINSGNHEMLVAQIEAFKKFIRRQKGFSEEKKNGYLNYLRYTRKLADIILENRPKVEFEKFTKNIADAKVVVQKKWLLEMAGRFE